MIRALVRGGMLCPIDPLPADWPEGATVELEGRVDFRDDQETWDRWLLEMNMLTAELNDPLEWAQLDAAMARQDRLAKQKVRETMESNP